MSKTLRVKDGATAPHGGAFYGPGWRMEMPDAEASAALDSGLWEIAPAKAAAPQKTQKPEGDALTAAITAAIGKLKPEDYGKDDVPNVKPLSDLLGYPVSAAERDVGLAAFRAAAEQ